MSLADYARIERAIVFLDRNFQQQPRLAQVARAAGLSEFHFQRLFRRWAGISPKRFLQFLTADYARGLLNHSHSALETACEAGLSSVSRLHDVMVQVYAATPGELKQHGAGLTIRYGRHPSPFGDCLVGVTAKGICWMSFGGESGFEAMRGQWPRAVMVEDAAVTRPVIDRAFGEPGVVALHLSGTNFQIRVWEALLRVPAGGVTTYEELASRIGAPSAVRAVANAVASNRISYLIPCHRVIRKTGAFGGYRWGVTRKRAMLAWEAASLAAAANRSARGAATLPG
jgi:AraC family transcriptional regulator of adaptative response/methylated-DNA-[protein]-cysteine methyltransferase